jgi:hypothetical protein
LDTFNPKSLPTLMRKVFAISANKISKASLTY